MVWQKQVVNRMDFVNLQIQQAVFMEVWFLIFPSFFTQEHLNQERINPNKFWKIDCPLITDSTICSSASGCTFDTSTGKCFAQLSTQNFTTNCPFTSNSICLQWSLCDSNLTSAVGHSNQKKPKNQKKKKNQKRLVFN